MPPPIEFFIKKFNPDVIGISIYTANVPEADSMIDKISKSFPNIPIIVGGPHPTLYHDKMQMKHEKEIDYKVVGEAEVTIINAVERAKKEKKAKVISTKEIVDPCDVPYPDYKSFYKWEYIRGYPIMTSRGCPYRCSFCPVMAISGGKWRPRKPEDCIKELELAKKSLNKHLRILIQDDNPLVDKERFYEFLELYISHKIDMRLSILNTRADSIDEKLLVLLKKAGADPIGIGVEHAHPEVFKMINKGESLQQIADAAKLLNKYKMLGSFAFIIGLPGDNLERIKASINFTRKFKPDSIFWNSVMPYEHTQIREWYKKNGRLYNEVGHTSLRDNDFRPDEPVVETDDFTKWERKKAFYMCLFETVDERLKISKLPQIFAEASRYGLYRDFFYWLPRGIIKSIKKEIELLQKAHAYYKREGFRELVKRVDFLLKTD